MHKGRGTDGRVVSIRTSVSFLLTCSFLLACSILLARSADAQIFELRNPASAPGDFFGTAVAIDDGTVLVGATGEDTCGTNSGAAYLYAPVDGAEEWKLSAKLIASDCEEGRFFGRSVALEGRTAVVAASNEFFSEEMPNAVYVFEPDSMGSWRETAKLTGGRPSTEGAFGTSVSIDGDRILVTTSGDPAGARVNGTAHVFERRHDEKWEHAGTFAPGGVRRGVFGTDGAVHGEHAVVSASTYFRYRPGSIYFFRMDPQTNRWMETARFDDVNDFFISVDLDVRRAIIGESKGGRNASGEATIFERDPGDEWRKVQTLQLEKPYDHGAFGTEVAIEGEYALVAAYDEQLGLDFNVHRVVYVFRRSSSGDWRQRQVIDVGDVALGTSVDVDAGYAVIGSAADAQPGAAYVVRLVE